MNLLILPVLLPLFSAAVLLLLRGALLRTVVASYAAALTLFCSSLIAYQSLQGEVLVMQMGGWSAPFGISLVADGLTGIMLLLSGVMGLLAVLLVGSSLQVPAARSDTPKLNRAREVFGAQALLQFLLMGVNMSFLTGDLFNLFVAFEVMLTASYGLMLLGSELPQLREGLKYVVVNLVASAVFVTTAGFAYGLFGSLNMADIALRVSAHHAEQGADLRVTFVAFLLALVFATKAALFPFGFWLPNAYPTPPVAVGAFFAAMLTKVGAYALLRSFTLMFPEQGGVQLFLLFLAGLTTVVGALGAITRRRWRYWLAFANVSSMGFIVMGIFSASPAGLAATVFYLITSVLVVFALFSIAGLAEQLAGKDYRRQGHIDRYPLLAVGYFLCLLSLAGLPPMSGFIGKFGLLQALLARGGLVATLVVALAIVSSLLLLYAGIVVWQKFFWGEDDAVHHVHLPMDMRIITASAVALVVAVTLFAGPLYQASTQVGEQLWHNSRYLEQVMQGAGQSMSPGGREHE